MSIARAAIRTTGDDATALSPAQYAILGLLRDAPAHGYQLQRAFAHGGDLAAVIPLEQASLYAALKGMAAQGLIRGVEARDGLRPPKTVYQLTADGERALTAWLKHPVERIRQIRLDFLLKVYFTRKHGRRAVRALVDAQIAACHDYLSRLQARTIEAARDDFAHLVIESRTSAAHSALEWLQEYRRRL